MRAAATGTEAEGGGRGLDATGAEKVVIVTGGVWTEAYAGGRGCVLDSISRMSRRSTGELNRDGILDGRGRQRMGALLTRNIAPVDGGLG